MLLCVDVSYCFVLMCHYCFVLMCHTALCWCVILLCVDVSLLLCVDVSLLLCVDVSLLLCVAVSYCFMLMCHIALCWCVILLCVVAESEGTLSFQLASVEDSATVNLWVSSFAFFSWLSHWTLSIVDVITNVPVILTLIIMDVIINFCVILTPIIMMLSQMSVLFWLWLSWMSSQISMLFWHWLSWMSSQIPLLSTLDTGYNGCQSEISLFFLHSTLIIMDVSHKYLVILTLDSIINVSHNSDYQYHGCWSQIFLLHWQ